MSDLHRMAFELFLSEWKQHGISKTYLEGTYLNCLEAAKVIQEVNEREESQRTEDTADQGSDQSSD